MNYIYIYKIKMNFFQRIGHKISSAVSRVGHKIRSGIGTVAGAVGRAGAKVNHIVGGTLGKVAGYVSDYGKYAVPIATLINPLAGMGLGALVAGSSVVSGANTISRGAMNLARKLK